MSWQIASFVILGLALAAGFAWYERSRPDARIVALVATLAAFAALGRIAFAAIPNVKPTTDIVLISGYALGGAPGFVVGAVAGLTSNFFFGQGPWTPWQMAGWGAIGVLGAGLAVVTHRRIGRWSLALVCAVLGYGFAALQDVGDWVNFSDHSAAQLGVYVVKGTGFDLVHAGGCLLFALAFGPALVRSIQRFARRLEISWLAAPSTTIPAAIVGLALVAGSGLGTPRSARAAATPTTYLLAAQNSDGGFGQAPGAASDPLFSGWAALGLASAGHNPLDVSHGGATLLDYVRASGGSYRDVGSLERTILVARAAGLSASSFGGHDLVASLRSRIKADGSVSDQVNLTAFAIMALRAAGVAPAAKTLAWLARQQNSDGGFSFATAGGGSDVDDTGAALEALGGGGSARRAIAFILAQQNRDGGFPSEPGGDSNAQSTAWAVQGLLAAGVNPGTIRHGGSASPLDYLRSLTAPDGHVRYARGTDQTPVWVSAEALMALQRTPLPLAPVARSAATAPRGGGAPAPRTHPVSTTPPVRAKPSGATHPKKAKQPAQSRTRVAPVTPLLTIQRLAATAGLITALVLAPVGAT